MVRIINSTYEHELWTAWRSYSIGTNNYEHTKFYGEIKYVYDLGDIITMAMGDS